MTFLMLMPAALSALSLSAHFLRNQQYLLVLLFLALIPLLAIRRFWAGRIVQIVLAAGAIVWIYTTYTIYHQRMATGEPFMRMLIILCGVAAFTLLSALLIQTPRLRRHFKIIP